MEHLIHREEDLVPMSEIERAKVVAAAADLEDLIPELRCIISEIRQNPDNINYAYKLAYYFRRDVGRIVSTLGTGIPL
jgi:hypothetical protein